MYRKHITSPQFAGIVPAMAIGWFAVTFNMTLARGEDFSVPPTISKPAQTALSQFRRAAARATLPAPDDVAAWKEVQAGIEMKRAEANSAVVRQYQPSIQAREVGGVPVLDIKPNGWKSSSDVLVYTHGGAYTMYSAQSRLMSAVPMAHDTGLRVVSVDYTLAPHAKWNAITDQVVAVIRALLAEGRTWNNIAIYGESAGGGWRPARF